MKLFAKFLILSYVFTFFFMPISPCFSRIKDKTVSQNSREIKDNPALSSEISSFENTVYGQSTYDKSLNERISKLEKEVFKQSYDNDDMSVRVNRLSQKLYPEEKVVSAQKNQKQNDYSDEIYEQSGGKIAIFGKMPIKVFFDNEYPNYYQAYFEKAAKEGFGEWQKATDNKIKFEYTNSPMQADVIVSWKDFDSDFKWATGFEKQDINAEKERRKYEKAGMITRVASIGTMIIGSLVGIPALGYLGSIGGSVASPVLQYKGMPIDNLTKKITLGTSNLKNLTEADAALKVKKASIHQMGHVLGIYGHSSSPKDIMNSAYSVSTVSERDINTLKFLYNSSRKE